MNQIFSSVCFATALIVVFVLILRDLDQPEVYYDEDAEGHNVCLRVVDKGVTKLCSAYSDEELGRFEWIQHFSMPK